MTSDQIVWYYDVSMYVYEKCSYCPHKLWTWAVISINCATTFLIVRVNWCNALRVLQPHIIYNLISAVSVITVLHTGSIESNISAKNKCVVVNHVDMHDPNKRKFCSLFFHCFVVCHPSELVSGEHYTLHTILKALQTWF